MVARLLTWACVFTLAARLADTKNVVQTERTTQATVTGWRMAVEMHLGQEQWLEIHTSEHQNIRTSEQIENKARLHTLEKHME